jgi:hypothetical protein
MFYDRNGEVIDQDKYYELVTDDEYRKVDVTEFEIDGEKIKVSTIWLGIDYGVFKLGPIIFETVIFGGKLDGDIVRYGTELEALTGHETACEKVRTQG